MGWGTGIGSMGWLGWLGPLVMLVVWAGIIGLVVWLTGGLLGIPNRHTLTTSTALDTLKHRYAEGEITTEEYQEGRRLLGS